MIIRCQSERLLDSRHVVWWDIEDPAGGETEYRLVAKTVLDELIEVCRGTEDECGTWKDAIANDVSEEDRRLQHVCEGFADRNDKLANALQRLMALIETRGR